MTRPVGSNGISITKLDWFPDITVQSKSMDFQVGTVGQCGQQMDREIMYPVRGNRKIKGLGKMGNFHENGDSTTVADIRFREGNSSGSDHLLEFIK